MDGCEYSVQEEVQPAGKSASSGLAKGVVVEFSKAEVLGSDGGLTLDGSSSRESAVPQQKADTGQVARNRRWRQKHREKYNAYMRQYRRERRKK